MPELPEVETVRRGLSPHIVGAVITAVDQRRRDLRFPFPEDFVRRLEGARALSLERRAKYLLLGLDRGETLIIHLGMTGRFTVDEDLAGRFDRVASVEAKHMHVALHTDRRERLAFHDARRFGYMDLVPTARLGESPHLARLGPEPLGPEFSAASLQAAFKGRSRSVKASLLDQRLVAGLGNIYVCEALHRARIDPQAEAGALRARPLGRLVREIRAVLLEAIESGGSTLRDYRATDGALGYFQHRFRVYGREGQICLTPSCGAEIRRMAQSGRSTFFCPRCQA